MKNKDVSHSVKAKEKEYLTYIKQKEG